MRREASLYPSVVTVAVVEMLQKRENDGDDGMKNVAWQTHMAILSPRSLFIVYLGLVHSTWLKPIKQRTITYRKFITSVYAFSPNRQLPPFLQFRLRDTSTTSQNATPKAK